MKTENFKHYYKVIVHGIVRYLEAGKQIEYYNNTCANLAIGQLMLYVDGMNGIIANNETIYWLYQLLDSPVSIL